MTTLDDLANIAADQTFNSNTPTYDAVEETINSHPHLVRSAIRDLLAARILRTFRDRALKPGSQYEQLSMQIGDDHFQIADRPVRVIGPDGIEHYKKRTLVTFDQAEDSRSWVIRQHLAEVQRAERETSLENQEMRRLAALGIDVTLPWDSIKHGIVEKTICWRCRHGYTEGDPFEEGHKKTVLTDGRVTNEVAWEHRSCNRKARANP